MVDWGGGSVVGGDVVVDVGLRYWADENTRFAVRFPPTF